MRHRLAYAAASAADPAGAQPLAPAVKSALEHPRLAPYHRLLVAVVAINGAVLGLHLDRGDWGIHAGSALAGTGWLAAFTVVATVAGADATTLALTYGLVALALLVVVCAAPAVRARAHNVFENTHRFGGWTAVGLFWALTLHLSAPAWHIWVLALVTAAIASPWLRLRRVPITVERPSSHAAIVRFDYGVTPDFAAAVGVSAARCASGTPSRRSQPRAGRATAC
jgi:hypothetical protein